MMKMTVIELQVYRICKSLEWVRHTKQAVYFMTSPTF